MPTRDTLARLPRWLFVAAVPMVALLVVGTIALAGGSDDGAGSASGGSSGPDATTIDIRNFAFDPEDLTVPLGTTLTVVNRDGAAHTLTARDGSFDTGNLGGGASGSITPDRAGRFAYFCEIHQYMTGTLRVS